MIPLRDRNPTYSTPFVTIALIVVNTLIFLYQWSLGPRVGEQFVFAYGMIPARIDLLLTGGGVTFGQTFSPLLTSTFLHGGWLHLIGNMWFLWVFGDNVEDQFGHVRYLVFYLLCGVGAGLVHTLFNLHSTVPAVGASGAISGVLGAYLVMFPGRRVLTVVWVVFFIFTVELPAFILLGYWFVLQALSGLGSLGMKAAGGVAWWAHIGGFLLGAAFTRAFRRPRRRVFVPY